MRRVTDLLDLATIALAVSAAAVGLGLSAALAVGAVGCGVLSWAIERR